jgi:hypothetical protein
MRTCLFSCVTVRRVRLAPDLPLKAVDTPPLREYIRAWREKIRSDIQPWRRS